MESPGKNNGSPLITRRVEARTTCLDTTPQTDPSGGGKPEFAVQLRCNVAKYIRAGDGRGRVHRQVRVYRGARAEASFVGAVGGVLADEDVVRGVMRRLLRAIRPLQDLDLTDDEWEAILSEDVVPLIADLARDRDGGSRAAAVVVLGVDRHVRYSAPLVLMTACKEAVAAPEGKKGGECSICSEALREEETPAAGKGGPMELPGCGHTFHRRCISKRFRKKPTCPLCGEEMTKHLDLELHKDLLDFSHDTDRLEA